MEKIRKQFLMKLWSEPRNHSSGKKLKTKTSKLKAAYKLKEK